MIRPASVWCPPGEVWVPGHCRPDEPTRRVEHDCKSLGTDCIHSIVEEEPGCPIGVMDCCETFECPTGPTEPPRLISDCFSETCLVDGSCIS